MAGIEIKDHMIVGKGFSAASQAKQGGITFEPYAVFNFDFLKAGDFGPAERARLFVRGGFTKMEGRFKASGLSYEGFQGSFDACMKGLTEHGLVSDVMNLGNDCILFSMNPGYQKYVKKAFSGLLVARFSTTEVRAQKVTGFLEDYGRHRDADMVAHKPYLDA